VHIRRLEFSSARIWENQIAQSGEFQSGSF